jgi:hypothetical protein
VFDSDVILVSMNASYPSPGIRKAAPMEATKMPGQRRCFFQNTRASGGQAEGWKRGSSEPIWNHQCLPDVVRRAPLTWYVTHVNHAMTLTHHNARKRASRDFMLVATLPHSARGLPR